MCLHSITEGRDFGAQGTGYKIMRRTGDGGYVPLLFPVGSPIYPNGRWHSAPSSHVKSIIDHGGSRLRQAWKALRGRLYYRLGFHIYADRPSIPSSTVGGDYAVVFVKWGNQLARGLERDREVIVADFIQIIGEMR